MDILVLYQFCSFGGVERVLLNRAMAFESIHSKVVLHVGYLQDAGALESFKEYIRNHHLEKRIRPFIFPEREVLDYSRYEMILNIDTPQVLQKTSHCKNVFVECHTHYQNNRSYLGNLPKNITTVIVPSRSFAALLQAEFPDLKDIFILPNPIPEAFHDRTDSSLVFGKRPLTFLARLDEQKNYPDVLRIFSSVQGRQDVFQLIIGWAEDPAGSWAELEKNQLVGNTFMREHLSFDKIPALINLVRQHRGVFISPSNGESFGLSAAEFICGRVPVLLSDIPAHRELVNGEARFLYPSGNIKAARRKLNQLLDEWDAASADLVQFSKKFLPNLFLNEWERFIKRMLQRP